MSLSENIKTAREARGISQEALAEAVGVSRQAVSKWETGASFPDMENLLAVSKLLDVPVETLTGTPVKSEAPAAPVAPHRRRTVLLGAAVLLCAAAAGLWLGRPQPHTALDPAASAPASGTNATVSPPADSSLIVTPNGGASPDVADAQTVRLLNSPESVVVQAAAQQFAKAYFRNDAAAIEDLLFYDQPAEGYGTDIWDELAYVVPKWDPRALTDGGELTLSMQAQRTDADSVVYLTLTLLQADGVWYVTSYALEG